MIPTMEYITTCEARRLCKAITRHSRRSRREHKNLWFEMLRQLVSRTHKPEENLLTYTNEEDGLLTKKKIEHLKTTKP